MDNKVTKERLNNHLEYEWFLYVLILIGSIVVFFFVFQQINANRDFEEINIFATCYEYKSNTFCEDTLAEWNGKGDKTVREINIEAQSTQGEQYSTLLSTHGNVTSDILILAKFHAEQSRGSYLAWDDELIERCIPEYYRDKAAFLTYEYTAENGEKKTVKCGLRVDTLKNIGDIFGFAPSDEIPDPLPEDDYGKHDTEFYLVINRDSRNIGKYHYKGKAKEENTQVFTLIRHLIETYQPDAA